jgi:hypothetical protein
MPMLGVKSHYSFISRPLPSGHEGRRKDRTDDDAGNRNKNDPRNSFAR